MEKPISESSSMNISLGTLVQAVVGIGSLVLIYANLSNSIMSIESRLDSIEKDVQANFEWRDNWENSGILPLDVKQNEKINYLEKELERLRNK
tara:strand:- start:4387 stop:4665 length:279 start_codon:yes stop_codon:yes gene_type:complete